MGLVAYVYAGGPYARTRNNRLVHPHGITGRVTLVDVPGPFEPKPDAPACRLVKRTFNYGSNYGSIVHVEPVEAPEGYPPRTMDGGAYVGCSDSRFREAVEELLGHAFYGALPLHDRYERSF